MTRHGRRRWFYVHKRRRAQLRGIDAPPPLIITPDVLSAYEDAKARLHGRSDLAAAGSLAWLCEKWRRSGDFKRLGELTRANYAGVMRRLCDERVGASTAGAEPFATLQRRHVVKLLDRVEGDDAANLRLKVIRRLFRWAIDEGVARENPARDVRARKVASLGHVAWTMEHVAAFEAHHGAGSKAWLALQLHLYTAARRSDVVRFGAVNVRGDRFRWVQAKGEGRAPRPVDIPLLPPLAAALDLCAPILGDQTFLVTEYGRPFTAKGYGGRMRSWIDAAGLPPDLSSHGLRKLVGVAAAEQGATSRQIQELLGHDDEAQAKTYTAQAERKRLASDGLLTAWGGPHLRPTPDASS